jgi:hypothetical protein
MKARRALFALLSAAALAAPAYAYRITYAEQFYKLFHEQLTMSTDDIMENIVWLEQALAADFANPLYALARIENGREWQQYRSLFKMHVNLKLVELHLKLASLYDKRVAYFYNAPWKEQNLASLDTAEGLYRKGLYYWQEALSWARKVRPYGINLEDIQEWEDEASRIRTGDLDYTRIIAEQLARVDRVRAAFRAMGPGTY